jgi:hypothetical protein
MSDVTLLKEIPVLEVKPDNNSKDFNTIKNCRCVDTITHCKCTYCKEVWCPAALGQGWCPNPECSQGIKGNKFQRWDEHFKWVQCLTCKLWFKTLDIMAVHNCYIDSGNVIPAIGGDGAGPLSPPVQEQQHEPEEQHPQPETRWQEQEDEEEQESEVDRYWRTHFNTKPRRKDNTTPQYRIQ